MRKKAKSPDPDARMAELRQMLVERRDAVQQQVQAVVRDRRLTRQSHVGDELDRSDAHIQGDMDFALLQLRADTLKRLDDALVRLDAGTYGRCLECGLEIASRRLKALVFAARCQSCEERLEQRRGQEERLALRRGRLSIFSDATNS